MGELLSKLLYYLGVGAAWEPVRRARRTKRGDRARASVHLGITALLLTVLLGFVGWLLLIVLGAEIKAKGLSGAQAEFIMVVLVCFFCLPFAIAWLVSAVAGLVMGVLALCGIRRRNDMPRALAGTFLNLLALAPPLILVWRL